MLRYCNDASSARLRGGTQTSQHGLVVGDVFNHIERPGKIEHARSWDIPCIHLHKLRFGRQTFSSVRQSRWMQFRADQPFPTPRSGDGTQNETGTAAYLEKPARLWKELGRQPNNQLVARDEPEMFRLQFGQFVERFWIEAADGVGKLRCERRNAFCLCNHMAASGTLPTERPDRFIASYRFNCIADQTTPTGCTRLAHATREPAAPILRALTLTHNLIIKRL